jgi:hypothetical protein
MLGAMRWVMTISGFGSGGFYLFWRSNEANANFRRRAVNARIGP